MNPQPQLVDRDRGLQLAFAWAADHLTDDEHRFLAIGDLLLNALFADGKVEYPELLAAYLSGRGFRRRASDGHLVPR